MICRAANKLPPVRARDDASHPFRMPRECLDTEPEKLMLSPCRRFRLEALAHPLATSHTRIVRSRLELTIKSSFGRYRAEEME